MKTFYLLPALLVATACDVPNNISRANSNGVTEFELLQGMNCWENTCMWYDASRDTFEIPGRYSIKAPVNSVQSNGYMTVPDFQQTFILANRAAFNDRDRD